jgi:hypothetical protein
MARFRISMSAASREGRRGREFPGLVGGAFRLLPWLAFVTLAAPSWAGFVGYYAPGNFTLTNSLADGFVTAAANGDWLALTGGNDGSGVFGTTELSIVAAASGVVTWDYSFASLDLPEQDYVEYRLGNVYVKFASINGQSSTVAFPVVAGQVFGWRMVTLDNIFEPGELTLSNFSAPEAVDLPEPGSALLSFIGLAAVFGFVAKKRR